LKIRNVIRTTSGTHTIKLSRRVAICHRLLSTSHLSQIIFCRQTDFCHLSQIWSVTDLICHRSFSFDRQISVICHRSHLSQIIFCRQTDFFHLSQISSVKDYFLSQISPVTDDRSPVWCFLLWSIKISYKIHAKFFFLSKAWVQISETLTFFN